LQAKITTEEDRNAVCTLKSVVSKSDELIEWYFAEINRNISQNLISALRDDSKLVSSDLLIAQLEVWNGQTVLSQRDVIDTFLHNGKSKYAFLTLVLLKDGYNIIVFRDIESLEYVADAFPTWSYDRQKLIAKTNHLILRKEMLSTILV
jgi:hypothetical protein